MSTAQLFRTTMKLNDRSGKYRSEVQAMSDANYLHKSLVTGFFSHLAQQEQDSLRSRSGMLHLPIMDQRGRVQAIIMQTEANPAPTDSPLQIPPYVEIASVAEINPVLEEGATVQFQVTVNASVARPNPNGGRGIREVVNNRLDAVEWWNKREQAMGLRTDGRVSVSDTSVKFHSATPGRAPRGWVYSGQGTVIDPQAFAQTVINGLGRSKAWGMGMMIFKEVK